MKIAFAFTLALVALPAVAGNKHIQCWIDDRGQRMCGDSVPPKYAGTAREGMNNRGVPVEQTPRALTPEEQVEAEKAKVRAEAEARAAEHQRAYDRYLLESYSNVGDLEKQRDTRVSALDTRIELVKKAQESSQAQLDSLVARKQQLQKENKPIDKKLEQQVQEYRRAVMENPKTLGALKHERDKLMKQFDTDIARFRDLRHEAPLHTGLEPTPPEPHESPVNVGLEPPPPQQPPPGP